MPNVSPTYIKMAENNINVLHIKCTRGIYSERLFKTISRGSNNYYPLEKLIWMKEFLEDNNQNIATYCLECLCNHGMKLDDITDILQRKINDRMFSLKAIEMAEKEDNPNILLMFMDEENYYVNRVILALKNTKHEDYLTTLMLSENERLVQAVNRITSKN